MKLILIFLILFFNILHLPLAFGELSFGFYSSSCPVAEDIVRQVVQRRFNRDVTISGALLRMHFHDCFVRGCDASILIDSTRGNKSEKAAEANFTVRGFDIIDDIKETLERECPSTVSCADIITLATRDAVALAGGPRYEVPTGRRDGLVSNPSDVNVPGPGLSVPQALESFTSKGMTLFEMVTLLGAHTVGFARCSFFRNRLVGDPTMDPALRAKLVRLCGTPSRPVRNGQPAVLDQNTSFVFDNQFYNQVLLNRAVLFIDQQLGLSSLSRGLAATARAFGGALWTRL